MTDSDAFTWRDLPEPQAKRLGTATLLATRIAMQNLVHPLGERYQEDFQICLDEVKHFIPEIDGLTFMHEGDLQVNVAEDYSSVTVSFVARKVTPVEAAAYQQLRERMAAELEKAARTQNPIKPNETCAIVTN